MTGFIRGLFGKKDDASNKPAKDKKAESKESVVKKVEKKTDRPKKESAAFYLDTNESKTYGNLDYMQSSKKIRRTFPKTMSDPEEKELVQEVSAINRIVEGKPGKLTITPVEPESTSALPSFDQVTDRRKGDSSMDMFRKMAKDIRK